MPISAEIGDHADAIRSYQDALVIRKRLAREDPSITQFQGDLARTYHNVGYQQRLAGLLADGKRSFEKALAIRERLAKENPGDDWTIT
jgi:hypothetical protein